MSFFRKSKISDHNCTITVIVGLGLVFYMSFFCRYFFLTDNWVVTAVTGVRPQLQLRLPDLQHCSLLVATWLVSHARSVDTPCEFTRILKNSCVGITVARSSNQLPRRRTAMYRSYSWCFFYYSVQSNSASRCVLRQLATVQYCTVRCSKEYILSLCARHMHAFFSWCGCWCCESITFRTFAFNPIHLTPRHPSWEHS